LTRPVTLSVADDVAKQQTATANFENDGQKAQ